MSGSSRTLRVASLDYLAWQLSLLTDPTLANLPTRKTPITDIEFPIFLEEPKGGLLVNKRLKFVQDDAKKVIEELQPYRIVAPANAPWIKPSDSFLWVLYRLANREKHREIAPIGLNIRFTINPNSFPSGVQNRTVPFTDGAVLGMYPAEFIEDGKGNLQIEPSFSILFSEAGAGTGISVEALIGLHNFIRDSVFPRFVRFLSR